MKVTYNGMDKHLNVTATVIFLEELAMSEYGAYEDGCAESKDLVNAVFHRTGSVLVGSVSPSKYVTVTIKLSTAEYLMRPTTLALHISKWREWASAGDFGLANAYVRSGVALQKHLEAAIG